MQMIREHLPKFLNFTSLVAKIRIYCGNLECHSTTVWMYKRYRNFKVG